MSSIEPLSDQQERLLTVREVAEILRVSVRQIWRMCSAGVLPPPVKVCERGTRFRNTDIRGYIRSLQPVTSFSNPVAAA